jgi:hypothetical protein
MKPVALQVAAADGSAEAPTMTAKAQIGAASFHQGAVMHASTRILPSQQKNRAARDGTIKPA